MRRVLVVSTDQNDSQQFHVHEWMNGRCVYYCTTCSLDLSANGVMANTSTNVTSDHRRWPHRR